MKNNENFSAEKMQQLLSSPAGQQLQKILQAHPEAASQAAKRAEAGDMKSVQQALSAFLADPKAQALLQQLQEDYHG